MLQYFNEFSYEKRKVAIFDIDGTIFRSSLLIELVEVLIENKLFNFSARKEYEKEETEWLDRKGDYESYINAVVKRVYEKYQRNFLRRL